MIIGIKNLRGLKDTGDIEIKPLTILLGQNSSGKSTFLRTFPLLKQSIETRTTGPILWYGRFVDYGDFAIAINDTAKEDFIEFTFEIDQEPIESFNRRRYIGRFRKSLQVFGNCKITMRIKGDKENRTFASYLSLTFDQFNVEFQIARNGLITEVLIDGKKYPVDNLHAINLGNSFFPQIISIGSEEKHYSMNPARYFDKQIFDQLKIYRVENLQKKLFMRL